jgi:hypothetical protein
MVFLNVTLYRLVDIQVEEGRGNRLNETLFLIYQSSRYETPEISNLKIN